jgi:hypothetical protein
MTGLFKGAVRATECKYYFKNPIRMGTGRSLGHGESRTMKQISCLISYCLLPAKEIIQAFLSSKNC